MDKIITLIIVFFIFKSLYRYLSGEEENKKGPTWQPPIPPHRPPPSSPSKTETRHAPRPDFTSTWREVSQGLRDIKRQANGQQEGIKTWEKTPHKEVSVTQPTKRKKDAQKDRVSIHGQMQQKEPIKKTIPLAKTEIIRKDKIISFDQPESFLQGIILSEILRPPMARRNHLLPPYLRG